MDSGQGSDTTADTDVANEPRATRVQHSHGTVTQPNGQKDAATAATGGCAAAAKNWRFLVARGGRRRPHLTNASNFKTWKDVERWQTSIYTKY